MFVCCVCGMNAQIYKCEYICASSQHKKRGTYLYKRIFYMHTCHMISLCMLGIYVYVYECTYVHM
jgi:hypothetical protein